MAEQFMWFKVEKGKSAIPSRLDELIFMDEKKIEFQREVGFYLGAVPQNYENNPDTTLATLDSYYQKARDGMINCPVNDTWSLMYFRTMIELLVNFIQIFRATQGLPPSKLINADLPELRSMVIVR